MRVIGVDAGGTRTVCQMADGDGRLLAESRGAGASLHADGVDGVERILCELVTQAAGAPVEQLDAVCLAIAGGDREEDARVLGGVLRRLGGRARALVVSDALAALEAGVGSAPGVVVICGTDAVAYGRSARQQAARAGGWGHVVGDEGSGCWIGRRALRAVARAADGRDQPTALVPRVLNHFAVSRAAELVTEIQARPRQPQALAQLARLVQQARDEGDEAATRILEEAAHELVRKARSVVERLRMREEPVRFVLAGGVFHGVPWLRDELCRRLPGIAARSQVDSLEVEPAAGAVQLALAEARGGARVPGLLP